MTQDLADFEKQLGEELVAAAYRIMETRDARSRTRRLVPILVGAVVTVAVVALAAFVVMDIRPTPVTAQPFEVVHLENEIHLDIVDVVDDPRAAEQELQEELGIDVTFEAVPTPPELVNQVTSALNWGSTSVKFVFGENGRNERIILPQTIDGALVVYYGRPALPGERYIHSITSPICRDLWALTPQESVPLLPQYADTIRYDMMDANYNYHSELSITKIDPNYRLIETTYMSDNELLVVYSAHLDALGDDRPNCGWSAP